MATKPTNCRLVLPLLRRQSAQLHMYRHWRVNIVLAAGRVFWREGVAKLNVFFVIRVIILGPNSVSQARVSIDMLL